MIEAAVIILIIVIPATILWINSIDKAIKNKEWDYYKAEEDREQEEYLKQYQEKMAKKRAKAEERRKKRGKGINRR